MLYNRQKEGCIMAARTLHDTKVRLSKQSAVLFLNGCLFILTMARCLLLLPEISYMRVYLKSWLTGLAL
jgi:hypothetical protein